MSCETRMARSFGTVREDGSKEGVRYSISGSEAVAMAHPLFCVYSRTYIFVVVASALLRCYGQKAKKLPEEDTVRKLFSDKFGEMLIVKRVNFEILYLLVLCRHGIRREI